MAHPKKLDNLCIQVLTNSQKNIQLSVLRSVLVIRVLTFVGQASEGLGRLGQKAYADLLRFESAQDARMCKFLFGEGRRGLITKIITLNLNIFTVCIYVFGMTTVTVQA